MGAWQFVDWAGMFLHGPVGRGIQQVHILTCKRVIQLREAAFFFNDRAIKKKKKHFLILKKKVRTAIKLKGGGA